MVLSKLVTYVAKVPNKVASYIPGSGRLDAALGGATVLGTGVGVGSFFLGGFVLYLAYTRLLPMVM